MINNPICVFTNLTNNSNSGCMPVAAVTSLYSNRINLWIILLQLENILWISPLHFLMHFLIPLNTFPPLLGPNTSILLCKK